MIGDKTCVNPSAWSSGGHPVRFMENGLNLKHGALRPENTKKRSSGRREAVASPAVAAKPQSRADHLALGQLLQGGYGLVGLLGDLEIGQPGRHVSARILDENEFECAFILAAGLE